MRIIDRDHDAISLEPNLDRTAFWMTIHGATRDLNRVLPLSVKETKILAYALLSHAEDLQRKSNGPVIETDWPFPDRMARHLVTEPFGVR